VSILIHFSLVPFHFCLRAMFIVHDRYRRCLLNFVEKFSQSFCQLPRLRRFNNFFLFQRIFALPLSLIHTHTHTHTYIHTHTYSHAHTYTHTHTHTHTHTQAHSHSHSLSLAPTFFLSTQNCYKLLRQTVFLSVFLFLS
jgi:hypothetical protein